ncbi:pinin-like isoform X1 [Euwallacea similis]|uniref:pinin-like isoform X1 n=1 Tax=Euwallacea similis TaxID=1736056 RepID=UPI00344E0D3D
MTAPSCYSSMSLVERKRQQWARERENGFITEELQKLGIPFSKNSPQYHINFDKSSERYRYSSKPSLVDYPSSHKQRRSSLPPLYQNQFNSNHNHHDRGGETSGYGSDSFPTPEYNRAPAGQSGYESCSSQRDDRAKWGDNNKGVVVSDPPNWVRRGLEADGAIVVANSSSPSVSPEQRGEDNDRPCTGSSVSQPRSYIRGQNVLIDASELAERERRRQLALAHQEAIRQQLEEREKRRQEERARLIMEEREEELRIEREQEHERQRKLEEERVLQEKKERERKRKEALQEAMEIAEREAKLEKVRAKMMKQQNLENCNNITENVVEKEKVLNSPKQQTELNNTKELSPRRVSISKEINNNLSNSTTSERSLTPVHNPAENMRGEHNNHQFTYFFHQPSLESIQNLQYALLIPTTSISQYSFAMPLSLPQPDSSRTENRVLTPTRYRNNAQKCDSSTQTDSSFLQSPGTTSESTLREKMSNLELSYENKRTRRSRSESMEERPKWGVNRPPTRYLKQSEKDLLYQRRKLRQKGGRTNKSYDEKNSSDDSQGGTPVRYKMDKRHSRTRWRAEERRMFSGNKMYQSEIVPLESDKDQLYMKCCCGCRCSRHQECSVDILKIEDSDHNSSAIKGDVLSKLSTLQNGLLLEQGKWETSPRTPS